MINAWTSLSPFFFFVWLLRLQLTIAHSPGDSGQDWKPNSWFLHPSGIRRSHTSCFWLLSVQLGYSHISVACSLPSVLALTPLFFCLFPGHLTLFCLVGSLSCLYTQYRHCGFPLSCLALALNHSLASLVSHLGFSQLSYLATVS